MNRLSGEKKNREEREAKRGERACRQTFEAAIPPSCNYLAEARSVSKIVICQSISRVSKTSGKINGNAPSENKGKWVASVIVDFDKSR